MGAKKRISPWEENQKRHSRIISRLEGLRVGGAPDSDEPPELLAAEAAAPPWERNRKRHSRIISRLESMRGSDAPDADEPPELLAAEAAAPWERNRKRHSRIISRLEGLRQDSALNQQDAAGLIQEARRAHRRVISKIEEARRRAAEEREEEASAQPALPFVEPPAPPPSPPPRETTAAREKHERESVDHIVSEEEHKRLEEGFTELAGGAAAGKEPKVPGEAKEADEVKAPEAAASAEAVTAESAGAEEAAEGAPELKERKVKYSLQLKLVAIIAVLLFVSLGTITTLVSALVSSDVQLTAEVNNFSINRRVAESMSNEFKNIRSAVASFLNDVSVIEVRNPGKGEELTSYFFQRQPNISAIALVSVDSGARHLLPSPLRSSVSVESMNTWLAAETEDIERARMGETLLRNASPFFGLPQLVMLLPVSISVNDAPPGSFCAAVFFSQGHITAMLGSGANISFAVNDDADVIVHGDPSLVLGGANFGQIPFIANALSSAGNGPQTLYTDENGVKYFGIYQRLVIGDVGVITIIRRSDVFSGIMATTNRNIIISVFVFLLSILIISVFARTMSVPLRLLTVAARKIEQGEYQLGLTHDSQDEIGALTRSFVSMGHGLENFEKFTNKAVVKLARRGKLSRGGVTKKITVSFVLIRDFGEISRKMNATQIVAFVNEYLELMVPCITATGGIVDKFLTQGGVIIMALWGSIDSAGSPEDDAFNCISSMMMIRACLMDFNEELQSRFWGYAPLIKIGCGINSGEVVAGQMGSESRMEYTVIGDTVNLAARLEGANDVFDTDILISENTWNLVKDKILVQEMQNIEVKGKAKPLRVFSVINMRDLHDAAELFEKLAVQRNKRQEDGKRVLRYFAATMEDVRALWRSALAE